MSRKSLHYDPAGQLYLVHRFLTMFCNDIIETGVVAMNHDQNLFVQAEMQALLDDLPVELVASHLSALHALSCAFETALQPAIQNGGATTVARFYLEAMRATLDCEEISPAMTEALMANVALRLGGQP